VPGYYVENFGCRATQADGAALERQFEDQGLSRASSLKHASVVVLNTCTVTTGADQDARAAIRRVRRQNPDARIVVTGCYAQRAPEEIAALPGVDLVVGNSHKHRLAEVVMGVPSHTADFGRCNGSDIGSQNASNFTRDLGTSESASAPEVPAFVPLNALQSLSRRPIFVSDIFGHTELLAAPVFDAANERTRPNLKIQDGCDNRCSFCVIPYVRGQSRSLPVDRIIQEVNTLVHAGYREVVISGINLGRWGRDLEPTTADVWTGAAPTKLGAVNERHVGTAIPAGHVGTAAPGCPGEQSSPTPARATLRTDESESLTPDARYLAPRLVDLIRTVLNETKLEKLRISSVEPMDWSDGLIDLVASSPRIAKHAHVPMQSGSDAVLRRMHRKYRPWHYREKIEKIHAAMPSAAIGADVMVGFPGETDAEFEATQRMIEQLPFTYLHVFTYSPRPGTPAADMKNQVPVHLARERNRILRELASEKKLAFMRSFIGKTLQAITLNVIGNNEFGEFTESLTDNYLKLRLRGRYESNRWQSVSVHDVVAGSLVGDRAV
jgi:threonylcarbamoyladenosine tRNA methylthiotransferase MtaB